MEHAETVKTLGGGSEYLHWLFGPLDRTPQTTKRLARLSESLAMIRLRGARRLKRSWLP
jgi:hypothetical protein